MGPQPRSFKTQWGDASIKSGSRQADRRDDKPLTDDERRWVRQMIQRIAALLALGPQLDGLYQEAAANAFTADELGIER